jgi:hypothetical protein
LLRLEGQHAQEDKVAFCHYTFVVIVDPDSEFLLEGTQKVRLACGHHKFEVWDLALDLQELGEDHGSHLPAADQAHLKDWLFRVIEIDGNFVGPRGLRHVDVQLGALLSVGPSAEGSKNLPVNAR